MRGMVVAAFNLRCVHGNNNGTRAHDTLFIAAQAISDNDDWMHSSTAKPFINVRPFVYDVFLCVAAYVCVCVL